MKVFKRNALGARSRWALLACLGAWALPVRAEQPTIIDATYTATADNTMESHYRIQPLAAAPTNWRAPVDYTSGMVRVRVEVLEKPSDKKTLVTICFEGNAKSCMPYPPAYTAPGVYTFAASFSNFWQYDKLDWGQGIKDVAVVLKTETEVEAQGDPLYYPAKMHVTVNLVLAPSSDDDAGATPKDAGATPKDAGTITPPRTDAGPVDAGVASKPDAAAKPDATVPDASSTSTPSAAGGSAAAAGANANPNHDAGSPSDVRKYLSSSDKGCSTTGPTSGAPGAVSWLVVAWLYAVNRRRARRAVRREL